MAAEMATTTAAKETLLALQLSCKGDAARESTLRDWVRFVEARGELAHLQDLPKSPQGAAIDWLQLYDEVVARGGFRVVSQRQLWPEILGPKALDLRMRPFQLASHYERFLRAFEEKQLFGRDLPVHETTSMAALRSKRHAEEVAEDEAAPVATLQELQDAQGGISGTPIPRASKRHKAQRELNAHLGTLHSVVLALDSGLPSEELTALNLLTVLSYGDHSAEQAQHPQHVSAAASLAATANENELLVDNVPGLLDALYRQLQSCALLPEQDTLTRLRDARAPRRRLLNLAVADGQREVLDARALQVLNILRNLALVGGNEKPLAAHDELCVFLLLALRYVDGADGWRSCSRSRAAVEIGDHVLDTLCAISKRLDFLSLHPPASLEVWSPHYQLSAQLWHKERVLPLECLLRELRRLLVARELKQQRRSVVLRVCELLANVCRDVGIKKALSASAALQDPALLDRVVALLGCSKAAFLPRMPRRRKQQADGHTQRDFAVEDDFDMDVEDEEEDEDETDDASRWPAPWENDGLPSGIGMGVVYVSPEGTRHTTSSPHVGGALAASAAAAQGLEQQDAAWQLDHEMRDAALDVLFRLSDGDNAAKLRLARHPTCLRRLAAVLLSCVGRPEAARVAVATLCNVSMNRATFPFFLPLEKDLMLAACSDRSVSDILNNVVADVYGMHSL